MNYDNPLRIAYLRPNQALVDFARNIRAILSIIRHRVLFFIFIPSVISFANKTQIFCHIHRGVAEGYVS